jgi:hypothetical protein
VTKVTVFLFFPLCLFIWLITFNPILITSFYQRPLFGEQSTVESQQLTVNIEKGDKSNTFSHHRFAAFLILIT